jgi:sugar lactone lactonase YvrE
VVRFRPDGGVDVELPVPMRHVTSLCFDGRLLVVVGARNDLDPERRGSVFRTYVGVAGAPFPRRV